MGKRTIMTTSLLFILFFLQTLKNIHAGESGDICYGDFSNGNYRVNRDYLFSSLPSNVVANGGFYNASFGRESGNNRVHVVALCRRGYDNQACKTCLEHVIEDTKAKCPQRKESFSWVTHEADDVSCNLRYTNHSTFGKLELLPITINPNPKDIDSSKNLTLIKQEWIAMVNRTLEAASTADTSSVLKYYNATRTEFTEISDVYALMQCTPDLSPSDCKRCLRECVAEFQRQYWGKQGGRVGRPSCYLRWDLYPFYNAFYNVTKVSPLQALIPQARAISVTSSKGKIFAIVVVPSVIILLVLIGLIRGYSQMRKWKNEISEQDCDLDVQSMLRFDLSMILTATEDFSPENKIGQGGFGSVYKGILPSGKEIAVKRLARGSGQGDTEFKNEVLLLAGLQHRNLVKLLGFCNEGDEYILIYEHVPNSSLDHYIFNEERRLLLTWNLRYRIIEGVARGLLYLHQDSQLRIIHRDLKASNILLDAKMNPKVSDFGMAMLFNMDQTRGVTRRRVGTFGYMAPEYVKNGRFSAKTDVYSFGVLLLEMITGQRNKNYFETLGLPAYAWKCWVAGEAASIIDPILSRSPTNEIMRFIHIGLLCVQEDVTKRPTMSLVIQWLGSDIIAIPLPTTAGFTTHPPTEMHRTDAMNQAKGEAGTLSLMNGLSITELSPR